MSKQWRWSTMGEVAEVVGGGTPKTDNPEYFGGDIPWITPADLSGYTEKYISRGKRNISQAGLNNSGARLMPAGTVLFSSRAPIGYVAIAANPVATNQGFKSFVLKEGLTPDYVYYYLQHAKKIAVGLASGTTFLEISGKKAAQIPIPVPPIEDQRKIVAEIEKQFTRLEAGVGALKRVQANLKRYRAAVLKAACEGKLVPTEAELVRKEGRKYETGAELLARILEERRKRWAGRGKYKEPASPHTDTLPPLPEGWVWTTIGACFNVAIGATPSRKEKSYWEGKIPWVSSGEVRFKRITETKERITQEGLENTSTQINPMGSVLLGMIGEGRTRGQTAILGIDACNNQNCAAIWVSKSGLPPEYTFYWLWSQYENTRRTSSGNNQPALNKTRVESMLIPIPPRAEQIRIVAEVERRLSVVEGLEVLVSLNLQRASSFRNSLLQIAFSTTRV